LKKLLRLPVVMDATGNSRATIYRGITQGTFPSPVRIGVRAVAWDADEVQSWIESKIAAARSPSGADDVKEGR
jgi:prophage regulatory protein